ncbi:MAG TPA: tryptophan 7-halogenase [Polyangia bacterium]|nr:tryptophan 7-halogenase [Polyangia bacterium]
MNNVYDVIILGAGIGGTLLATILARHGARVLIVEKGEHPRFAVGESTVPETTFLLEVLARRYDVPEIGHLRNFHRVRRHVSAACGVKRNFSFVYHRDGEPHRARESTQFPTWGPPFGPDVHLFRQDVDAYLLAVAVRYGADVRQRADAAEIDFDMNGVRISTHPGGEARARFLIDGCGHRSPLARRFGLRREPCPMHTRTRTLFTHMVGVPPYDRVAPPAREHGMPSPFSQGTLHHLFDRGWFWIIPFDNHPDSTNPLCSVGLSVDVDVHPRADEPPEDEFWRTVRRFPSVEKQLAGARAVRPWVATDRMQYSTERAAGDRWFLLPHSAGFVDALFSQGLALTTSTVNGLAHRLLAAISDGDFSHARFQPLEETMLRGIAHHDRTVACSYASTRDFALWNAWHRVWMLGSTWGATGHVELLSRFEADGDRRHFERFDDPLYRGTQSIGVPEFMALFDAAAREVEAVRDAGRAPRDAAERIFALLRESGLCPAPWRLTDPEHRCPATFTLPSLAALAAWGFFRAPPSLRHNFDLRGRIGGVLASLGESAFAEVRRSAGLVTDLVKDALVPHTRR